MRFKHFLDVVIIVKDDPLRFLYRVRFVERRLASVPGESIRSLLTS